MSARGWRVRCIYIQLLCPFASPTLHGDSASRLASQFLLSCGGCWLLVRACGACWPGLSAGWFLARMLAVEQRCEVCATFVSGLYLYLWGDQFVGIVVTSILARKAYNKCSVHNADGKGCCRNRAWDCWYGNGEKHTNVRCTIYIPVDRLLTYW